MGLNKKQQKNDKITVIGTYPYLTQEEIDRYVTIFLFRAHHIILKSLMISKIQEQEARYRHRSI